MSPEKKKKREVLKLSRKAAALRKAGFTYRDIAGALNISLNWARQMTRRGLDEERRSKNDEVSEFHHLSIERLEAILKSYFKAATEDGNLKAAKVVMDIVEQQARLLGLNAPVKSTQVLEANIRSEGELRAQAEILGMVVPNKEIPMTPQPSLTDESNQELEVIEYTEKEPEVIPEDS